MTSKSWKGVERAIAKRLRTKRTGALNADNADLHHHEFSFEVKSRKSPFRMLDKFFEQAKRNGHGRTPVIIIHIDNRRHDNDYVLMELKDWEKLADDHLY